MTISFTDRVAIVTGAGGGIGREYALELAKRGAKVVVNDLGGSRDGSGQSDAAEQVAEEIRSSGGEAMANGGSVTEFEQMEKMVADAMQKWGGVHVLLNNAGILRDKSFSKMTMDDFNLVLQVHTMGSANCTKAVWEIMKEQAYGRIMMTTSSTGMYGNFGQANYGAAKAALAGLTKTLHLEGTKYNIKCNSLIPIAATRMTEDIMPDGALDILNPKWVVPAALFLVSEDGPNNVILGAGGGFFHTANVTLTQGMALPEDERTPEGVAANFEAISSREGEFVPQSGGEHGAQAFKKLGELAK